MGGHHPQGPDNYRMQVTIFNLRRDRETLWRKGQRVDVFAGYTADVYGRAATGHVQSWQQIARNGGLDIGTQLTCSQPMEATVAVELFDDCEVAGVIEQDTSVRDGAIFALDLCKRTVRNPELLPDTPVGRNIPMVPDGPVAVFRELVRRSGLVADTDGDEFVLARSIHQGEGTAQYNLTAQTGMIGVPRTTDYGLEVKATVLPQLLIGNLATVNGGVVHRCRGLTHNLSFEGTDWNTTLELEAPEAASDEPA